MDFTLKAYTIAGKHMTKTPASFTYFSVVSCKSIRIDLVLAALKDSDILACDIGN